MAMQASSDAPRVLVVDDEAMLADLLSQALRHEGWETATAKDGLDALAKATSFHPDVVILDVQMPRMDGLETLERLRARDPELPVLFLTARDAVADRVQGLRAGADDYVTKPYNPAVLLARIQSVLRRAARTEPPSRIEHKGVVLDVAKSRVEYEGRGVELTRNEFRVLHLLMENKGAIISRQELMMELWQSDAFIDDNTLTVNVNRLRKSLASIGVPDGFLATRRGQGYLV